MSTTTPQKKKLVIDRNYNVESDQLTLMVNIKSSGLTLPAITCMAIVNDNFSAKYPMIYTGEVHAHYLEISRDTMSTTWSYTAIGRMLRILAKKEYLSRERHGQYVAYGMTKKGIDMLVRLGIIEAPAKKKVAVKKK